MYLHDLSRAPRLTTASAQIAHAFDAESGSGVVPNGVISRLLPREANSEGWT